MTPVNQLIEELKVDIHKTEMIMKRSGASECQRKLYNKHIEVLNDILFKLESNYLTAENNYFKKIKP